MTERDWEHLPALLVDDVAYHNPAQFEPMTDLVVMLRPASVVAKLGEEAARRVAAAKSQT